MKKYINVLFCLLMLFSVTACREKNKVSETTATELQLKQGKLISCGPPEKEFGEVAFTTSCSQETKKDFELAIALLHSFEYDEAEKAFAKVIEKDPNCAMAYWGVAMSNYHPLWAPPSQDELKKGAAAIRIAQSINTGNTTEKGFINALAVFYQKPETTDHKTRSMNYKHAMEQLYLANKTSKETAIFYALSLIASADPADKQFINQKKAGAILSALYPEGPNHPGIVHYIIHAYDSPELAILALPSARKYASIAPSSAHAQHMPSHIFTRLGLWDECIQSNMVAAASAKCYAENAGLKGSWDEELHAIDYLMYGYLQKGDNTLAKQQLDYLYSIKDVSPVNFKVFYAFAAVPSRYYLENKLWKEAAQLNFYPKDYAWDKNPWQKAIVHFTRLLGFVNSNRNNEAKHELQQLQAIYDQLLAEKNSYNANQVLIQVKTGNAWIAFKEGKQKEALEFMNDAVVLEDNTEKHPVTPGEVLPARQLLGDMLLQMKKPAEAFAAYEAELGKHPNRFNSLYGAATASEQLQDEQKAITYYQQLVQVANSPGSNRPELSYAKTYLKQRKKQGNTLMIAFRTGITFVQQLRGNFSCLYF